MLIDRFMPDYDVVERHSIYVDAPGDVVFRTVDGLTPEEVPSFGVLMGIRSLPSRLARKDEIPRRGNEPALQQLKDAGFKELIRHAPTETVIGVIGRFWQLKPTILTDFGAPNEFVSFEQPGYTKATMNFHVWPEGEGSMLTSETRVKATDDIARRRFRRYWLVVRPGSAVIRHGLLKAVKKKAEAVAA
jgi:hypothetical protein